MAVVWTMHPAGETPERLTDSSNNRQVRRNTVFCTDDDTAIVGSIGNIPSFCKQFEIV
jgi:hypothetical protein